MARESIRRPAENKRGHNPRAGLQEIRRRQRDVEGAGDTLQEDHPTVAQRAVPERDGHERQLGWIRGGSGEVSRVGDERGACKLQPRHPRRHLRAGIHRNVSGLV